MFLSLLITESLVFCLGVALLPFVDERRLLKALESVYPKLTEEESMWFFYCVYLLKISKFWNVF